MKSILIFLLMLCFTPVIYAYEAIQSDCSTVTAFGQLCIDTDDAKMYKGNGAAATEMGSGGMVYPGAGIALSTGSAWGTSITNNSANWDTAYGWGNHADATETFGTAGTLTWTFNTGVGTDPTMTCIDASCTFSNELIATGGIASGASATPTVVWKDSDATAGDSNTTMAVNCTDVGNGTEDCDITLNTQIAGTLTTVQTVDADGNINFVLPVESKSPVTLNTAATVVLTTADCMGGMFINNDADVIDYTLPGAAAGLECCFYDIAGGVITVDPTDAADTIYLNGTALTAGNAIDSPGAAGDSICLMSLDATRWITINRVGTWIDGGAD